MYHYIIICLAAWHSRVRIRAQAAHIFEKFSIIRLALVHYIFLLCAVNTRGAQGMQASGTNWTAGAVSVVIALISENAASVATCFQKHTSYCVQDVCAKLNPLFFMGTLRDSFCAAVVQKNVIVAAKFLSLTKTITFAL